MKNTAHSNLINEGRVGQQKHKIIMIQQNDSIFIILLYRLNKRFIFSRASRRDVECIISIQGILTKDDNASLLHKQEDVLSEKVYDSTVNENSAQRSILCMRSMCARKR